MQEKIKNEKGITLVALIITIIILLILAGVTLSLVIGENGLIAKSKQSAEKYKDKAKEEQWQLEDFEAGMEEIGLDELQDEEEHPELKPMKLVLTITEDDKEIYFPVPYNYNGYTYNCTVDWDDGTEKDEVTNDNARNIKHKYTKSGTYTISIEGVYEKLFMKYSCDNLIEVKQWGMTGIKEINLVGCSNLKKIATPSKNSFINMETFYDSFNGCTSLTNIPEKLFANCPNVTKYQSTFEECTSLTNIPERLFANSSNVTEYRSTFEGCTSLTSIPERLFANCLNATSFFRTFNRCSNVANIPERLFANCSNAKIFYKTFSENSSLTNIPENLFTNCSNAIGFDSTFDECTKLTNIPSTLFINCSNVINFNGTFSGCTSLTSVPSDLFDSCPNVTDFGGTFWGCSNLMGNSLQLWKEEKRNNKRNN